MDGVVIEDRSNSFFLVELENGHEVLCSISGKMRQRNIRVSTGDKVRVDVSIYDLTKGRIEYRYNAAGTAPVDPGARGKSKKKR